MFLQCTQHNRYLTHVKLHLQNISSVKHKACSPKSQPVCADLFTAAEFCSCVLQTTYKRFPFNTTQFQIMQVLMQNCNFLGLKLSLKESVIVFGQHVSLIREFNSTCLELPAVGTGCDNKNKPCKSEYSCWQSFTCQPLSKKQSFLGK